MGSLTELAVAFSARLAKPTSPIILLLPPLELQVRFHVYLYVGSWDLNPGPQTCTESTMPTEPLL